VIHGFGNLLCFANVRVLPKPPWLLVVEIPGLWFKQTKLIDGFLLEESPWVSDLSILQEVKCGQLIPMDLKYFINATTQRSFISITLCATMKINGHHKEVSWCITLAWIKQMCLGSEATNKIRDGDATKKSVLLIGLGTIRILSRGEC
jgi:hypothetical protein